MINEFWNLVLEIWQQGIRGIGIDNIIIWLLIILGSLVARALMNTYLLDKIAKLTEKSETTLDDESKMKRFYDFISGLELKQIEHKTYYCNFLYKIFLL